MFCFLFLSLLLSVSVPGLLSEPTIRVASCSVRSLG